jgi:hypothetical protein
VIAEPTRTINQSRARKLLGKAAGGCGGALNSLLVVLGDRCGLYATGQYSSEVEEPIVPSKAISIAQKPTSSGARKGAPHTHGSASPGQDRTTSVQPEETAFMTLICHECAAATDSHMRTPPRSPQG